MIIRNYMRMTAIIRNYTMAISAMHVRRYMRRQKRIRRTARRLHDLLGPY